MAGIKIVIKEHDLTNQFNLFIVKILSYCSLTDKIIYYINPFIPITNLQIHKLVNVANDILLSYELKNIKISKSLICAEIIYSIAKKYHIAQYLDKNYPRDDHLPTKYVNIIYSILESGSKQKRLHDCEAQYTAMHFNISNARHSTKKIELSNILKVFPNLNILSSPCVQYLEICKECYQTPFTTIINTDFITSFLDHLYAYLIISFSDFKKQFDFQFKKIDALGYGYLAQLNSLSKNHKKISCNCNTINPELEKLHKDLKLIICAYPCQDITCISDFPVIKKMYEQFDEAVLKASILDKDIDKMIKSVKHYMKTENSIFDQFNIIYSQLQLKLSKLSSYETDNKYYMLLIYSILIRYNKYCLHAAEVSYNISNKKYKFGQSVYLYKTVIDYLITNTINEQDILLSKLSTLKNSLSAIIHNYNSSLPLFEILYTRTQQLLSNVVTADDLTKLFYKVIFDSKSLANAQGEFNEAFRDRYHTKVSLILAKFYTHYEYIPNSLSESFILETIPSILEYDFYYNMEFLTIDDLIHYIEISDKFITNVGNTMHEYSLKSKYPEIEYSEFDYDYILLKLQTISELTTSSNKQSNICILNPIVEEVVNELIDKVERTEASEKFINNIHINEDYIVSKYPKMLFEFNYTLPNINEYKQWLSTESCCSFFSYSQHDNMIFKKYSTLSLLLKYLGNLDDCNNIISTIEKITDILATTTFNTNSFLMECRLDALRNIHNSLKSCTPPSTHAEIISSKLASIRSIFPLSRRLTHGMN